jgi:hypothetical protein
MWSCLREWSVNSASPPTCGQSLIEPISLVLTSPHANRQSGRSRISEPLAYSARDRFNTFRSGMQKAKPVGLALSLLASCQPDQGANADEGQISPTGGGAPSKTFLQMLLDLASW